MKSYWVVLRERKVTGICKGSQGYVLSGELAVKYAMDPTQLGLRNERRLCTQRVGRNRDLRVSSLLGRGQRSSFLQREFLIVFFSGALSVVVNQVRSVGVSTCLLPELMRGDVLPVCPCSVNCSVFDYVQGQVYLCVHYLLRQVFIICTVTGHDRVMDEETRDVTVRYGLPRHRKTSLQNL